MTDKELRKHGGWSYPFVKVDHVLLGLDQPRQEGSSLGHPDDPDVLARVSWRQIQADVHQRGPVDPEQLQDEGGQLFLRVGVAFEDGRVGRGPEELGEVGVDEVNR